MVDKRTEPGYLARIEASLRNVDGVIGDLVHSPVGTLGRSERIRDTELKLSRMLRDCLLQPGEGWLCEEDVDNHSRLQCDAVWVVDPIDGTTELVNGVPEWSVSVGLISSGNVVAGGVYNPTTKELFLGSESHGVTYNGNPARASDQASLQDAVVLASRQEVSRGEWSRFDGRSIRIKPTGSIAYKLALVAAGLADATWTLSPRNEWDIAAGVALVRASGGRVSATGGAEIRCNRRDTLLPGVVASGERLWSELNSMLAEVAACERSPARP